ncbi:MAG: hypothetical protein A2912_00360 [Candidatus Buchananbacteria bacterium RIFCSPLOWO2_01_FULL_40_23b]|uniref:SMC-Scp complex subunit ScpB n=1 Tax=Candidatus Buchananbacteria bacterium RIFCSPLOWO2_01_FULL_40_23b TaxID=1797544 RepID=A0A1G1YNJ6_9BACT|nr:MAG: hypothetical protein A2912_00360 [Candidatus Buchananbacteria bacterium RIFCSPLOWO2_01_FULL_40_23b]
MDSLALDAQIEALLFWKSEPLDTQELAKILEKTEGEISDALRGLEERLLQTGLRLVRNGTMVMLGTAPEMGGLIEALQKEELQKDLGKAALETLTIILYRAPVSKGELDYIRGVNSSFILRALLVRGLIERSINQNDKRSFVYRPTFDLLSHLGLSRIEDLPEYGAVAQEIKKFEEEFKTDSL